MRAGTWTCIIGLLLTASARLQAQAPQDDQPLTTLKLNTQVVSVAAFVRDKQGHPTGGLTPNDFSLKQDGKPQGIRYFSQGSDLPLTLTLMVDTSGSQRSFIPDETAASRIFFREMLTPGGPGKQPDRAALVQFDYGIVDLEPLTSDPEKLERSLGYLSYPHASLLPPGRAGTLLFDAICRVAPRMAPERGRKAMLLLTDGGDNGSKATLAEAVTAAQKADVVVYAIFYSAWSGFTRPSASMQGPSAERGGLEKLASETGGQVFDTGPGHSLREIYAQIGEQLRLQYLLGYRPPESAPGSYHKIELKPRDGKLIVQARKGFYTPQ